MNGEFWSAYNRRKAINHAQLMIAATYAVRELPPGAARDRLVAAIAEYEAVSKVLGDYVKSKEFA